MPSLIYGRNRGSSVAGSVAPIGSTAAACLPQLEHFGHTNSQKGRNRPPVSARQQMRKRRKGGGSQLNASSEPCLELNRLSSDVNSTVPGTERVGNAIRGSDIHIIPAGLTTPFPVDHELVLIKSGRQRQLNAPVSFGVLLQWRQRRIPVVECSGQKNGFRIRGMARKRSRAQFGRSGSQTLLHGRTFSFRSRFRLRLRHQKFASRWDAKVRGCQRRDTCFASLARSLALQQVVLFPSRGAARMSGVSGTSSCPKCGRECSSLSQFRQGKHLGTKLGHKARWHADRMVCQVPNGYGLWRAPRPIGR